MAGRVWLGRENWRKHSGGLAVLALVVAVGFALIPHVPGHEPYKAHGLAELWDAWLSVMSWPQHNKWCGLVLYAPFLLLAIKCLRTRAPLNARAWLILAVGAWGVLQSLGLAYGRARLTPLAPRYLDVFVPTLCASFACFCEWLMFLGAQKRWRCWGMVLGGAWMVCAVQGAVSQFVFVTLPELDDWANLKRDQGATVRQYLETKEAALLSERPIPLVNRAQLQQLLDDPTIVNILPTNLKPAMNSSRMASEDAFFNRSYFEKGGAPTPGSQRYWSSYGPNGAAHRGEIELKFSGTKQGRVLEFFVAGNPRADGMSLQLRDKEGRVTDLAPHFSSPDARWRSVLVKIPPGSFSVVAKDNSSEHWLAISNPHEVGLLSHYAEGFMRLPEAAGGFITLPLAFAVAVMLWAFSMIVGVGTPPSGFQKSGLGDTV